MTIERVEGTRLSLPPRTVGREKLSDAQSRTLLRVADCLIPGGGGDPKASDAPGYDAWLDRAVDARAESVAGIIEAVTILQDVEDRELWPALESMSTEQPTLFHILSSVVAGAYVMVPEIMARIGYPGQKRNPASVDEAFEQIGDGILEPVVERGHFYRGTP